MTAGDGATSGDYSVSPASSVAFTTTSARESITVTATDDDEETVTITFGSSLPLTYVAGTTSTVTVTLDEPANSQATGRPTIAGQAVQGATLTVDTTGISDGNGLNSAEFSYQ